MKTLEKVMGTARKSNIFIALIIIISMSAFIQTNAYAEAAEIIDIKVNETLKKFREEVAGGKDFLNSAKGVLIFPEVIKAGLGIGGEYGEGALKIGGKTVDYYSTASASIGFQLGVQVKSVIIVFLQQQALDDFRKSDGWKAGVDGSVALVTLGAGGSIDTNNVKDPIIGFVIGNKGLMYNLTLEGSKISKLIR